MISKQFKDPYLDPAREVHIQFTNQNMSDYPKPLSDERPIYRDTFR